MTRGHWRGVSYVNRYGQQITSWRYIVGRMRRHHNQRRHQRHQGQRTREQTKQRSTQAASTMPVAALVIGGLLIGGYFLLHSPATQQILQALFGSMIR